MRPMGGRRGAGDGGKEVSVLKSFGKFSFSWRASFLYKCNPDKSS